MYLLGKYEFAYAYDSPGKDLLYAFLRLSSVSL